MCGFCEKKLHKILSPYQTAYRNSSGLRYAIKDNVIFHVKKKNNLYIKFRFDFVYDINFIETVVQFGFH